MNRPVGLAARRVRQTLSFANGTQVLTGLASTGTRWHRDELVFRTRDGLRIACPNRAGARVPLYEVFVEDCYRLRDAGSGPLTGLPADPVVLDVGAQVGCFSLAVAQRLPAARIHAYEASPNTASWLYRNVLDNGFAGQIAPLAVALSDRYGTLDLVDDAQPRATDGLISPGGGAVTVPCVTFAQAVTHAGGRVDLVKIDTDGDEYDIVLGSDPQHWDGVRTVVLEYHDVPGHDRHELVDFLAGAGLVQTGHAPAGPRRGFLWLGREG